MPLLFLAVNRSGPVPAPLARRTLPQEPYEPTRCTWYCHNHGCPHHPRLGAFLSGDDGLFGFTYRDANALLFFVVWPVVTIALVAVVLWQRAKLNQLERGG